MSTSDILAACRLLLEPGQVTELRILHTRYKTVSGYFNDLEKLAAAALEWSGKASAVYFTLNPVKSALLARAANRLKHYADQTTADADVLRRLRASTCRTMPPVPSSSSAALTPSRCVSLMTRWWSISPSLTRRGFGSCTAR
jgi:hypothetical protein